MSQTLNRRISTPTEQRNEFGEGRVGIAYYTVTDQETIERWGPGVTTVWVNTLNVRLFGREIGEAAWTCIR